MGKRKMFSGHLGFILATAGSAVGLGNLWRFPTLATKYGGGSFVLLYIIFVATIGFSLVLTEAAIGRKFHCNVVDAYRKINRKFTFLGYIAVLVAFLILSYYCVIGGWILKFITVYFSGNELLAAGDGFFDGFISKGTWPVLFQALFVLFNMFVVMLGVQNGVERLNKVLMPALIILSIIVSIFALSMDGALEGLKYYLVPDFSKLSFRAVLAALGQMFFSLSLGMGVTITYGSYVRKDIDLEKATKKIELFDTGIALLAGFMVIPAIFAVFSSSSESLENALQAGSTLVFITLPKVFIKMPFSGWIGGAFFLLIFFAALTSSIALMETVISTWKEKLHLKRKSCTILVGLIAFLAGIPASLGYGIWDSVSIFGMNILDFTDFCTNQLLMPLGAVMTCILVSYIWGTWHLTDEIKKSSAFHREKWYLILIKYITPVAVVITLISSILNTFGMIQL